jgi:hypothetical protein
MLQPKEEPSAMAALDDDMSASQADAEDRAYANVAEVWEEILGILGSDNPIDWVRSADRGHIDNYFDGSVMLWEKLNIPVRWDVTLPNECLTKQGSIIALPLTFAAFQERVGGMETCWKQVSKVRCMDVLKRIFMGAKGLETDAELPTLVVQPEFATMPLKELKFVSAHAGCTTRLMAAHVAMRLLIYLDMNGKRKNLFEVPEVMQAVASFARLNCHCRIMTASERTVLALGPSLRWSFDVSGLICNVATTVPCNAKAYQCQGFRDPSDMCDLFIWCAIQ